MFLSCLQSFLYLWLFMLLVPPFLQFSLGFLAVPFSFASVLPVPPSFLFFVLAVPLFHLFPLCQMSLLSFCFLCACCTFSITFSYGVQGLKGIGCFLLYIFISVHSFTCSSFLYVSFFLTGCFFITFSPSPCRILYFSVEKNLFHFSSSPFFLFSSHPHLDLHRAG